MELHGSQGGSIVAERLTGGSSPPVHERDRICALPSCGVRLSIYNGSEYCALHERPRPHGRAGH